MIIAALDAAPPKYPPFWGLPAYLAFIAEQIIDWNVNKEYDIGDLVPIFVAAGVIDDTSEKRAALLIQLKRWSPLKSSKNDKQSDVMPHSDNKPSRPRKNKTGGNGGQKSDSGVAASVDEPAPDGGVVPEGQPAQNGRIASGGQPVQDGGGAPRDRPAKDGEKAQETAAKGDDAPPTPKRTYGKNLNTVGMALSRDLSDDEL
jgi:hypothetical protein